MSLSIYNKTTNHSLENKIIINTSVFIRRHIPYVFSVLFCWFIVTIFSALLIVKYDFDFTIWYEYNKNTLTYTVYLSLPQHKFVKIPLIRHMFNLLKALSIHRAMTWWLRHWIPNPGVPGSKPPGGSKVNSAFHPSDVGQLSTKNSCKLNGKK